MIELLKTQSWNLHEPYENQKTEQELNDWHKQLVNVLGKPEYKLVLRIIDGKDRLEDETGLDRFIFGFRLATQLAHELKKYDEHLHGEQNADEDVRRSSCVQSIQQANKPELSKDDAVQVLFYTLIKRKAGAVALQRLPVF